MLAAIRRNARNSTLKTLFLPVRISLAIIESVLRAEVPSGEVVNVSYAQQGARGYGEVRTKRLLVFTQNSVYLNSSLHPCVRFSDGYEVGSKTEKVIYGAFIYSHKAKHFVVLTSMEDKYLVKTYSITQESETKNAKLRRLFEMMVKLDSRLGGRTGKQPANEEACTLTTGDVRELSEFAGHKLLCIKTIKNISAEQSELIITSEEKIGTVMMSKRSILAVVVQDVGKKVIGVEYWNGYYFLLCDNNSLSICRRGISRLIEEIKFKDFANLRPGLKVTMFKLPKLEWSGRLPDMLHKEISGVLILVGECKRKSYIVKYNVLTGQCLGSVVVNSLAEVTTINYGPYDNGPIVVGLSDGTLLVYEYYSLELVRKVRNIHTTQIKDIAYEPGNAIVATSGNLISELLDF